MGHFYVNISVRTEDRARLQAAFSTGDPGFIGPAETGWTTFTTEALDTQNDRIIDGYGVKLSDALGVPTVGALNHDDDILLLSAYQSGRQIAHFHSDPGYFTGADDPPRLKDVHQFADLTGADLGSLSTLLSEDHLFAVDLHVKVAALLGLPAYSAGFGFEYARDGEFSNLDLLTFG